MKTKLYILGLCSLFLCSGCDDMLDTKSKTLLSQSQIQTESGCESMLLGVYDLMQEPEFYGRDILTVPEVLADNSRLSPMASRYKGQEDNRIGSHLDIWVESYEIIALLNEVIEYAEKLPETSKAKAILGESYALRGLTYFNLARVYGREPKHLVDGFDLCVPLILKAFFYDGGPMDEDVYPKRATVDQVWEQIETDLNNGFELLSGNDEGLMPKRMSSLAAKAILSRVFLYESKWNECVEAADYVMKNAPFGVYDGTYTDIFSKGEENLFYLVFTNSENLGSSSLQSVNGMAPSEVDDEGYDIGKGVGDADLCVAEELVALFDQEKDVRFKILRKAKINGSKVWWTTKFSGWQGAFGLDNVPIIRMSEVLLNRAEAESELGNDNSALADVNELRTKRGLDPVTLSGEDLLNEVLLQRRLELAQEGHRFFDLKRRGQDITKPAGRTLVPYTDFRVVARISETQMDANKNLVNNPGY
ncbi:RagB/SusD family nutrient uptake outer membrane protein [Bacteroides ilei]|uniref:RagB/SusD family nutrient uptake outer membrane protein n=1 Tax=Bacteroides ilei TaxID=1907658 RepID=UPI0009315D57|nr:RagB/SusD family nutrient uptake outer membrane protein [Bacteroides ilei]